MIEKGFRPPRRARAAAPAAASGAAVGRSAARGSVVRVRMRTARGIVSSLAA